MSTITERAPAIPDRNLNLPERGPNLPERGSALPERGSALPERGSNQPERGSNQPERGPSQDRSSLERGSSQEKVMGLVNSYQQRMGQKDVNRNSASWYERGNNNFQNVETTFYSTSEAG